MASQLEIAQNIVNKLRMQINQKLTAGRFTPSELNSLQSALAKAVDDLNALQAANDGIAVMSWDDSAGTNPDPVIYRD